VVVALLQIIILMEITPQVVNPFGVKVGRNSGVRIFFSKLLINFLLQLYLLCFFLCGIGSKCDGIMWGRGRRRNDVVTVGTFGLGALNGLRLQALQEFYNFMVERNDRCVAMHRSTKRVKDWSVLVLEVDIKFPHLLLPPHSTILLFTSLT
jgi:hypothetical protein